jgi:AraC-like DNA-binding protein
MTILLRAGGIRGYAALMRDLGRDPLPLLRRHKIRLKSLDDEDTLLPLRSVIHLMEASAADTHCGDFGLRMAKFHDVSILGPLGIAMQNAWTVRDGIGCASRFLFLQSPGLVVSFFDRSEIDDDAVELSIDIVIEPRPPMRQSIDISLGSVHRITQLLAGEHYRLKTVTLPHTPVAPLAAYRRFFGVRVVPGQERASLHISRTTFRARLRGANPALKEIAEDYLQRHFRNPNDSVTSRVRLAVRRTLSAQRAGKNEVAAMLGFHPRTLQRRLEAEGSSFETIKDTVRKEIARQYLRETTIPLAKLASMLAFPEHSALTRSCRRWFGVPPSAIRRGRIPLTENRKES